VRYFGIEVDDALEIAEQAEEQTGCNGEGAGQSVPEEF